MPSNLHLKKFRTDLLNFTQKLTQPIDIGLTATLILFGESNATPNAALQLALETDQKNITRLPSEIQLMLGQLAQYVTHYNTATVDRITNLKEAIASIGNHPEWEIKPHVATIFRAIDSACQWTDTELNRHEGKLADIPPASEQEATHVFHADLYPGTTAKRNALNRLQYALISTWNQSLAQPDGLINFLSNIQNTFCIEGATRSALKKAGLAASDGQASKTFLDAMHSYHDQALSLLEFLNLERTLENMQVCIVAAHNGEKCLIDASRPTVITDNSVQQYLQDLRLYDNDEKIKLDWVENSQALIKNNFFPDDYRGITRLCLARAILPYADNQHTDQFARLFSQYAENKSPGAFPLYYLASTPLGQTFLIEWLKRDPQSFAEIPANTWSRPVANGKHAGTSAINHLASTSLIQKFWVEWLKRDPQSFAQLPADAWSRLVTYGQYGGTCAIDYLARTSSGQTFLLEWLKRDPQSFTHIPADVWFHTATDGKHSGTCAIYYLASTPLGQTFLSEWPQYNPQSFAQIPADLWSRAVMDGENDVFGVTEVTELKTMIAQYIPNVAQPTTRRRSSNFFIDQMLSENSAYINGAKAILAALNDKQPLSLTDFDPVKIKNSTFKKIVIKAQKLFPEGINPDKKSILDNRMK